MISGSATSTETVHSLSSSDLSVAPLGVSPKGLTTGLRRVFGGTPNTAGETPALPSKSDSDFFALARWLNPGSTARHEITHGASLASSMGAGVSECS